MRLSTPRILAHLRHLLLGCGVITTLLASSFAQASPPHRLTVQGVLEDELGNPVLGDQTVVIRLYAQPAGGVALASETRQVTCTDGLFNVELDTLGDPDLYRSSGGGIAEDWHFSVAVAGEAELMPRLRIGTVPFAHMSTGLDGDVQTSQGRIRVTAQQDPDYLNEMVLSSEEDSAMIMMLDSSKITGATGRYQLKAGIPLRSTMEIDDDGDGVDDGEIENSVIPGTSSVAIKTKGTGADPNRIVSSTYEDSTVQTMSLSTASAGTREINSRNLPSATVQELKWLPSPGHTTLTRSSVYADSAEHITTVSGPGGVSSGTESKTKPKKSTTTSTSLPSPGHTTLVRNSAGEDTGSVEVSVETTGDNDPEGDASIMVMPTTSSVAIKTKGTGADANRVVSTTYPDSTVHSMTMESGGLVTGEISQRQRPSSSIATIKVHPSPGHTTLILHRAYADSAAHGVSIDTDGDADPESDMSTFVTPGTCSVAIKTKGTGADKNRVSSTVYADSAEHITTVYGPGGSSSGTETKTKPKKTTTTSTSLPSPGHTTLVRNSAGEDTGIVVVSVETTDDNDPESDYSAMVTPGTCNVAIKTRGTGADKNIVMCGTTSDSAHVDVSSGDVSSISMCSKPGGVGLPGGSSLTMLHDEGVAGSSSVEMFADLIDSYLNLKDDGLTTYRVSSSSGMQMMDNSGIAVTVIDRFGNAAFSNSVGVGVSSTTHPIEHSSGAHLTAGGTWTNASDVNLKENFEEVDGDELLSQLSQLPITRWNYKNEDSSAAHIGPTAQDFQKAFGVGSNGTSISTIDPSGIALAAIKELESRNRELTEQNDLLARRLESLLERVGQLEKANAR